MILEVQIRVPGGGEDRTLQFAKSPLRIGRNQLNDISIQDPFVSEWHGTIRFDQAGVSYFDLGSTNGTLLDGKRLIKNVGVDLSADSRLQLGLIDLSVRRLAEPGRAGATAEPGRAGATKEWNRADMDLALEPRSAGKPGPSSHPVTRKPEEKPGFEHEAGRDKGAAPPQQPLRTAPQPSRQAPHGEEALAALVDRQRKLLEAFAEAFIGLRKGYEQFGAEVGVRTVSGTTVFHRARTWQELMESLLQPSADVGVTRAELVAIFADFGIHEMAMMQGATEGGRAALQALSPQANGIDVGTRLFSGGKAKNQWKEYVERFDRILTDDRELHAAIFGTHFARAYASVTVGDPGTAGGDSDARGGRWKR